VAFPKIVENMETWNDIGILHNQGSYGVPAFIFTDVLLVNEQIKEVQGVLPETPYNWVEFLSFGDELLNQKGIPLIADSKRFPVFVWQYFNLFSPDKLVFDTDTFRDHMQRIKQSFDQGIISSDANALFSVEGSTGYPSSEVTLAALPLIGDKRLILSEFHSLGINKQLDKASLAAEFLAIYASEDVQKQAYIGIAGVGLLADSAKYRSLYDWVEPPTKEEEIFWKESLKYGVAYQPNVDFRIFIGDQVEAFMNGTIDIDTLVACLDTKYRMVIGE